MLDAMFSPNVKENKVLDPYLCSTLDIGDTDITNQLTFVKDQKHFYSKRDHEVFETSQSLTTR